MKSLSINTGKDGGEEESKVLHAIGSLEFTKTDISVCNIDRKKLDPKQTLVSNGRRFRERSSCRVLFDPNIHGFHSSIPKHIAAFDEKYALHCLELIHNCALRAGAWSFPSKGGSLPDSSVLAETKTGSSNYMSVAEVIFNSTSDWPIGTVTGSPSMFNIMRSSLLRQSGSLDFDVNFGRANLLDDSEPVCSGHTDSEQESSDSLTNNPQDKAAVPDHKYVAAPYHRRFASVSSTNSSCSDRSSSSASVSSFQGMLQYTWKDGLPHHVFTIDDKREVYVAKVECSDDKVLDYVYTFNLSKKVKKECGIKELEFETVGNMRVSTSITFDSSNSEIRETHFILSVSCDGPIGELQISNQSLSKNKRLAKKVADVFRSSHSHKRSSCSKFGASDAIFEDTPWEPSDDMHNSLDSGQEKKYVPNLELAAIIVKDIYKNREEATLGGWGLKFLKKSGNYASLETSRCNRDAKDCSTSLSVLIPAGLHGGPKTVVGGPSSLADRWISGGHCDCGGWDIGCPITVLNSRSSSSDCSSKADNSGECKSIDLLMQGSKQDFPVFKMVNIHEGLYYIHFQSTLSSLQSFAIAAAIIHSRSPVLRSKVYRS